MKTISLSALTLFLGLSLVCGNPLATKPGTKITKNEAEHIALRQHKGARVTAAKLETVEGKKIWVIEIAQGKSQTQVQVDAVSGRVVASEKVDR
ncbi:MAG: PepSY domain-containing protein [Chthoniobacterales bacterium]